MTVENIIHLMSDPEGNSSFCFPESPDVFRDAKKTKPSYVWARGIGTYFGRESEAWWNKMKQQNNLAYFSSRCKMNEFKSKSVPWLKDYLTNSGFQVSDQG